MQVTPTPVPILPTTQAQETMAKAPAAALAQAAAPIIQRAVDPSGKSDRGNSTRSNSDRAKGGGKSPKDDKRGGTVNLRV